MSDNNNDILHVEGGKPLNGTIKVRGAKNFVSKAMVAALLAPGTSVLKNVPEIRDVHVVSDLLRLHGVDVTVDGDHGVVTIDATNVQLADVADVDTLSGSSRIPILFSGPLLHRLGEAFIPALGGCNIGGRPINFHLDTLRKLGADVDILDLNYDDCVRQAAKEAAATPHGVMVQDTAWDGYEEIPSWIMQGYGTMAMEAGEQLKAQGVERPTHIFVQAGVGSLAGAVVGYFANLYKDNPPKFIVVEASAAACLYKGAAAGDGKPRMVTTPWASEELPMAQAAELGTRKVICDHSTVGIVVTTDGSVTEIPREDYLEAEERVIRELQELGKLAGNSVAAAQNLEGIQAEAIAFILNINILNTEKLCQVFQTHQRRNGIFGKTAMKTAHLLRLLIAIMINNGKIIFLLLMQIMY